MGERAKTFYILFLLVIIIAEALSILHLDSENRRLGAEIERPSSDRIPIQETVRPARYHVGETGVHMRLTQEVFITKAAWDSKAECWKYDVHYNMTNGVAAWSEEKKALPEYELEAVENHPEKTP